MGDLDYGASGGSSYGPPNPLMSLPYGSLSPNQQLSPYLSIDPSIFKSGEPQYILPEGVNSHQRGRFELAFSHIGGGIMAGFGLGASTGVYRALADKNLKTLPWNVYRTQMLNYLVKHAAGAARPLGVIMLFYSGIGVLLWKLRGGADDEINTVTAATFTGLLFKSSAGTVQAAAKGAGIGAALGIGVCLISPSSRQNVKEILRSVTS